MGIGTPSNDTSPTEAAVTVNGELILPPLVVTTTVPAPRLAPEGTVVVMDVALPAATVAKIPPMVTLAPPRPVPVIVTAVPTDADEGVTVVIVGAATVDGWVTVKGTEYAGATAVVTVRPPIATTAPTGTEVIICVPVLAVIVAGVLLMVTLFAPPRPVPVMMTVVPTAPEVGITDVIVGATAARGGSTVKAIEYAGGVLVVTVMPPTPTDAPAGMVVVNCEPVLLLTLAVALLIVRLVRPAKLAPLMVMMSPTDPLREESAEMVGGTGMATMLLHLDVSMSILAALNVTVAFTQVTPLTLTVCALTLTVCA